MSENVAALLKLEQQLRKASSLAQLFYTIVNETHQCVPYTQAVLLTDSGVGKQRVVAASDIQAVDHTAPYVHWIERLERATASASENDDRPTSFLSADVDAVLANEWRALAPDHLLRLPLRVAADGDRLTGVLLLLRDRGWSGPELAMLGHLSGSMAHALFALQRRASWRWLRKGVRHRRLPLLVMAILFLLSWLPVRLSVLAPVEVIPANPRVIAAPLNGAIRSVEVTPNQQVQANEILVQFEDLELVNAEEVAQKALLVAQAELRSAQQSGFQDPKQKARLAELEAGVRLRQAELSLARSRLNKATVVAPEAGIAIVGNPDEWQGRPVSIGERILMLADPTQVELEVQLPVKDAVALSDGAKVSVFLDTDPLRSYPAHVRHAEYAPRLTSEEILSYRLVAVFSPTDTPLPRIGTRGTAKVYGESVSLFFYLFRRPITSARQWLGW